MKSLHRWSVAVAVLAAFFVACSPALAQWQVPLDTTPVGRGSGTGFLNSGTVTIYAAAKGAKCDGSTNDTAAIQSAITAAALVGGIVQLPAGQCILNSGLTASQPIIIRGVGMAAGPGAVQNTRNTQLLANFASGDVIAYTGNYGLTIEDIQFNSNVGARTSGAAIHVAGPSAGSNNGNTIIRRVAFNNMYRDIHFENVQRPTITQTYHQNWVNVAIYGNSNATAETDAGEIANNYFFGEVSTTATQLAAVYLENGYTRVHDNLIIGSQYGIRAVFSNFAVGNPAFYSNIIENQALNGIRISNGTIAGAGVTADNLQITGNSFKVTLADTGSVLNAHIQIDANSGTGGSWISNCSIANNVYRSQITTASAHYLKINSCSNVVISNDAVTTISSDTANGITVGSEATLVTVSNFKFTGAGSGTKYGTLTTSTTVFDPIGMAFASLPSTIGNGSQVWCSDCTVSSNPASASGTGSYAFRENGAWVARSGLAANQVGNAQLRQSAALSLIGRSANSTGNVADISATAASDCVFRESASVLGCGTIATAGIANNAITLAKLATQNDQTVLGNVSGGSAVPSALTRTQITTFLAGGSAWTQGSVLFAGASGLMSQDNATFFWDITNKRLSLGTNSNPSNYRLLVSDTANGTLSCFGGSARGFRLNVDASASYIDGTDQTCGGSFQSLGIGGLDVSIRLSGSVSSKFHSSGGFSVNSTSDPGAGMIYTNSASFMIRTKTSYSNGAAAATGTLTNAPAAGNPTKWIPVDDNGTTRYVPAW